MKTKIKSMNDALAFLLQGLYYAETKLKEEFPLCSNKVTSTKIRNEIDNYTQSADSKMLKLERIFNYLMKEPLTRQNPAINDLMEETHDMLASTTSTHLRDILTIGCIQSINAYKIANYRSAYMFAVEMELDTATDLLQQILEWETDAHKALASLSIEEFNRAQLRQQT
jgi:ferritin-like metal-binding protein YciE